MGNHVEAIVVSSTTPQGRVGCFKPDDKGDQTGICKACGATVKFTGVSKDETVIEVACDGKCAKQAGFYTKKDEDLHPEDKVSDTTQEQKSESAQSKPEPEKPKRGPCEKCGGPVFRNGWKHEEDCPVSTKNIQKSIADAREANKTRETCVACGGVKMRNKFRHSVGCILSMRSEK